MELFLDTGLISEIEKLNTLLAIDGVTTNPTIVAKEGKKLKDLIGEIEGIIGKDKSIHAQVISRDVEGMLNEATTIAKYSDNIFIKIPVTQQGLIAIKALKAEGIKTTATAIFTAHQAFLAAKAGASYVAPYVNRLDNISCDGVNVVKDIVNIVNTYGFNTKVLAASFKNAQQVLEILKFGVHSVTIPADVASVMMAHPLTDYSVDNFISDWEHVFGVGVKATD